MKNGPYPPFTRPARINVVGVSGSGKSTFAKRLSAATGIRYLEMDALYWKPGWTDSTDEEFFAKLEQALEGEERSGFWTATTPAANPSNGAMSP